MDTLLIIMDSTVSKVMILTGIIETAFGTTVRIAILRRLASVSKPLSGLVLKQDHGKYSLALPMLGDFIRRQAA